MCVLEKLRALRGVEKQQLANGFRNAIRNTQSLDLAWVPAHCAIEGNERADCLATEGSQLEQIESDLTYRELETIIKNSLQNKWKETHPKLNRQDGVHQLHRRNQRTVFRLWTGHNRFRHHVKMEFLSRRDRISAHVEGRQNS
ncbi:RNA-directed DNA polymerase from [Elysia marginata]|uniref:RNA-directed DNA polymerase from n=1 Tax=Elysia marginata TaxID=1093978 RepID=A0AAV4GQB1_9GAST|nr:RNA-directed DNA polymerase from [Elysia marginata]